MPALPSLLRDPRHYQIAVLASLLLYGVTRLDLEVRPLHAAGALAAALGAQWAATRLWRLPAFDPRSALISGLSLCLLLRTNLLALALAAAAVTILSKFALRVRGKHLWNPTNFGIVATMLATGKVWVSPGQWGNAAFFAFLLACLGGLVVNRAARSDVTYAFLGAYLAILFGRALWLGQPLAIPLHQLGNGAFLIFTFFMISDPKTTPDSRAGRILFAALVALGAGFVTFVLYRPNGLLLSLFFLAPVVPLLDLLLPGRRYAWSAPGGTAMHRPPTHSPLVRPAVTAGLLACLAGAPAAHAFCGFYVAKADTKLWNRASQVALVRDGDRTVLTMANDFKGDPKEFAIVIPVPTFLEREQIHVAERALLEHLDAYSAPRLVEYHDPDPCMEYDLHAIRAPMAMNEAAAVGGAQSRAKSLGVTIEASYTVGEYDILILSAKESSGLETWLRENGYRIPEGASRVLGSYLKQGMRFFVAKVNLEEQSKLGFTYLRPLQVAYESPKFMLPIRLGMVNAQGPQELFIYTLTRKGRVETTNYRTVRLPSDQDVPLFVKDDFGQFYKAMFGRQVAKHAMEVVFLEYAWDMAWCDPCAADPLSAEELRELGVFWLDGGGRGDGRGSFRPPRPVPGGGAQDVFLTRLHVRYDDAHFPEDLVFQETADRENFQGRYVLHHPWTGKASCRAAQTYRASLRERREKEAQNLAWLTGWDMTKIRNRMNLKASGPAEEAEPWWKSIWRD